MNFLKIAKIFFSISLIVLVILWLGGFNPFFNHGGDTFGFCDPFDFEDEYAAQCTEELCPALADICVFYNQSYVTLIAMNIVILLAILFFRNK